MTQSLLVKIAELEADKNNKFFFEKVKKTSGCWLWMNAKRCGYGWIRNPDTKKNTGAHRWIMLKLYGEPPHKHEVCHRCNVRACVNPEHLYYGTRQDNIKDMIKNGNHNFLGHKRVGINSPHAILTEDQVRLIRQLRASGLTYKAISTKLNLNINTVGGVICKLRYASVT